MNICSYVKEEQNNSSSEKIAFVKDDFCLIKTYFSILIVIKTARLLLCDFVVKSETIWKILKIRSTCLHFF
jgi:hypothetical protein